MVGFKYKMSNIQAAVGCAQLERIDELICQKRNIFHSYKLEFEHLPLQINPEPEECINGFWMPTIVVNPEISFCRDQALSLCHKAAIDARPFFYPLSSTGLFRSKPLGTNKNSESIHLRALNLPSYHSLTSQDIKNVANLFRDLLSR